MAITTKKCGKLEYLTAEGIGAAHCFTTRLGGVSTGYLDSLNIGMHRGDEPENVAKNYEILASALGFDVKNLVLTHQVHSAAVRVVTKADAMGIDHHEYPECDGLVTNDPGTVLVVFSADCTPVLLHDSVTGAVGAVHAGWRGTAADIVGNAVRAMTENFGSKPENIRAAIGPNIGKCCFQTDAEVPGAMIETLGEAAKNYIEEKDQKYYVDLKGINAALLRRAGVEHIDISTDCTKCRCDRFWSHRVTGTCRGSQGAIIVCKEG